MNQSVFKTLEYAKIITMLQNMATSSMGKELAEKLLPSSDIDEVIENLSHTQEASNILISSEPPFGIIQCLLVLFVQNNNLIFLLGIGLWIIAVCIYSLIIFCQITKKL